MVDSTTLSLSYARSVFEVPSSGAIYDLATSFASSDPGGSLAPFYVPHLQHASKTIGQGSTPREKDISKELLSIVRLVALRLPDTAEDGLINGFEAV